MSNNLCAKNDRFWLGKLSVRMAIIIFPAIVLAELRLSVFRKFVFFSLRDRLHLFIYHASMFMSEDNVVLPIVLGFNTQCLFLHVLIYTLIETHNLKE